jgi:hypothetical protein
MKSQIISSNSMVENQKKKEKKPKKLIRYKNKTQNKNILEILKFHIWLFLYQDWEAGAMIEPHIQEVLIREGEENLKLVTAVPIYSSIFHTKLLHMRF